ncbi:IPT/TIG domain-containing protein [Hymenobacter rubripertinctus]|uniref:IPT/TIG domain-containing protein n=1 Tax=Hymenobacter rubripertinctus TaxID=2029981 RepID=UPI00363533A2
MQLAATTSSDTTPPVFANGSPAVLGVSSDGFTLSSALDEVGKTYFVVLANGAAAPSATQVKAGQNNAGTEVAVNLRGSIANPTANAAATAVVSGLAANTAYEVYLVAEDAVPNLQAGPSKVAVTTLMAPVPTITSFTPANGPVGRSVTINGTGFTNTATVGFNGTAATSVTFVSASQLLATVPVGATSGPVTVTVGSNTATTTTSFTVDLVVISQVYGGGGNAGSTYKNDFIELFNRGSAPVSLAGWSVQYASATGTTWQVTPLTNVTIPAGGYYLIQEAAGNGGTTSLPAPDAIGTISMAAGAFKVALMNTTTPLTGGCPKALAVDFVGVGTADCSEGTAPTAGLAASTAALRKSNGCQDTDDNAADFAVAAAAPRNSAVAPAPCGSVSTNPVISAITPTSGPIGTVVTITGANFGTITGVNFNGTPAASFTTNAANTTITATVSAGTTTGAVALTAGSATYPGPVFTVTTPLIVAAPTSLTGFGSMQGTPSASQSYTVRGDGLGTANLTVAAPANYEVSLSAASGYAATQTLAPNNAGNVPTTTVYVRLTGTNQGAFNGNVENTSAIAATVLVAVSGSVTPAGTLTVSPASLSGFVATVGQNSPSQSYQLMGSNLTDAVAIAAPVGYEVATAVSGPYASTLQLPLSGGAIAATIYVRLRDNLSTGSYSGGVSNVSGALARSVALSGTVTTGSLATEPTTVGTISFGTITANSIRVNVTAGDGSGRLLVVREGSSIDADPADGLTYTASAAYGAGSEIGTLNYVVLRGGAAGVTVAGLVPGTQYFFKLYEYNGSGGTTNYQTTTTNVNSVTTTTAVATTGPGQLLLEEDFDYPAGTVLTSTGNWQAVSGAGTNPVQAASGSLATNMYGSPSTVGLAASLVNTGEDVIREFAPAVAGGDVYVAFEVQIADVGSNDQYFLALTPGGNVNSYAGRVVVRNSPATAGRINIGLSFTSGSPVYATDAGGSLIDYEANHTYLAVMRYRKLPDAADDQVRLYVFDNTTPLTEPLVPEVNDLMAPGIQAEINPAAVLLRQYNSSQRLVVDGLRVGTGWGAVVGRPRFIDEQFSLKAGNYYDVEINLPTAASTVAVAGKVQIESQLTLTQGVLVTTAASLLTLRNSATTSAGTAASFVDGPLAWEYLNNQTNTFPLGRDGVFRPVTLNIAQSGVGTYRLELLNEPAPAYALPTNITRRSQIRYYVVERIAGTPTATSGQISLSYGADDGVNDPAYLRILNSRNGQDYTDEGPTTGGSGSPSGSITSRLLTQDFVAQNIFTLGNQTPGTNPLPVELIRFTAERQGAAVRVQWATASERNNARFEVQRSATGQQFDAVATVAGQGTTASAHAYTTLDRQPLPGTSYYRLRQVDADGQEAFSGVVAVTAPGELVLYPNPATRELNLRVPATAVRYRVISVLGSTVLEGAVTNGAARLDVTGLPTGLYQLEVTTEGGWSMRKFIKQ